MKKTIEDLQLENKKVILRVDFNVPISNNTIMDTKRIDEELPTIKYILSKNASLIILSHLGRVKTEEDKKTKSLEIVAKKLAQLLNRGVKFINENRSEAVTNAAKNLKPGEILVLENTRFQDLNNKAESNNDEDLAKYWASLGDVYVNDAFGTAHRAHASTYGISQYSKESALGFLMNNEVEHLQKLLVGFKRPFVAIIGGAKVSDKIKVLEKLFELADKVLIVGGMAYTFQKALNRKIGTSIFEEDKVEMAKEYLNKYKDKIVLPIDNAYVDEFADKTPKFTSPENPDIPDGNMGLDIGPESIKLFASIIKNAKLSFEMAQQEWLNSVTLKLEQKELQPLLLKIEIAIQ